MQSLFYTLFYILYLEYIKQLVNIVNPQLDVKICDIKYEALLKYIFS